MKASTIFSIFVVLLFLFSACNSIAPTPTATATLPAVPTAPAPAVTEAPTAVPKPADIAVGAIDSQYPEAGPKPNGATDIALDPITHTYEWTKANSEHPDRPLYFKTVPNLEVQGWYWNSDSAPLTEGSAFGTSSQMHIWCEEGTGCPVLIHPSNYTDPGTGLTFSTALYSQIEARATGIKTQFNTQEQINAFNKEFKNNNVVITAKTAKGDTITYKIRPESSMNIYIKKTPLSNPDFTSKTFKLQASISGDHNNDFNVVEYSLDSVSSMSHIDFLGHFLYYPFTLFFTDDMSQSSVSNWIMSPGVGMLVSSSIKGSNPYFIITP